MLYFLMIWKRKIKHELHMVEMVLEGMECFVLRIVMLFEHGMRENVLNVLFQFHQVMNHSK